MHAFTKVGAFGDPMPDVLQQRFSSTLDVVEYVAQDPYFFYGLYPRAWHLDDDGHVRCESWLTTLDGIRWWRLHPENLYRSRRQGVAAGACPPRWVIVEPWWRDDQTSPHEGDAADFAHVRLGLGRRGVELLDVVLVDDRTAKWWSMRELTSGSLDWCSGARV